MDKLAELKAISERVTKAVCSVNGHVSKADSNRLRQLERETGKVWDAINGQWSNLSDNPDEEEWVNA